MLGSDHFSLIYNLIVPRNAAQRERCGWNQGGWKLAVGQLNHVKGVCSVSPHFVLHVNVLVGLFGLVVILLVKNVLTEVFIRVGSLFLWFPMGNYLVRHLREHGDLRLIKNAIGHLALVNGSAVAEVGCHGEPYVVDD